MKLNAARGSTSRMVWVFLPDSASTTGAGKTGLTNASAALNITVRREKSGAVSTYSGANIGAVAALGTWADPGAGKANFKEVDAANLPGIYELHFVNAIFDASDTSRWLAGMVTATGVAPSPFEFALDALDPQDGVRAGLTALPNAAAGANGGLPLGDANARVDVSKVGGAALNALVAGRMDSSVGAVAANAIDAGAIAADAIGSSELAASAVNEIRDAILSDSTPFAGALIPAIAGYIDTEVAAIKAKTDQLAFTNANKVDASLQAAADVSAAAGNAIADALLKRDWTAVAGEASRSVLNALRFLRNKWSIAGGTLTVTKEDDAAAAWTGAVTTTAGDPVSQIDPT